MAKDAFVLLQAGAESPWGVGAGPLDGADADATARTLAAQRPGLRAAVVQVKDTYTAIVAVEKDPAPKV